MLLRALAVVGAVAAPALLVFALAPTLVLRIGFGSEYEVASGALGVLALAMSVLGFAYLAVQFLLAVDASRFLLALAAVAVAEPVLLLAVGTGSLAAFAAIVLAVQVLAAVAVLVPSLRASGARTVPA